MTAPKTSTGDRLAFLAGARLDLLRAAPGSRSKFVALGGILLTTGALAVVSMAFAMVMALGAPWPLAVLVGLAWGVVIVNLDRMLLVGMSHDSSVWRNLVMAVPRLGLAIVLGTVIATPLTLQVFASEIAPEVVEMQAEKADAFATAQLEDEQLQRIPELEARVEAAQRVIRTGGEVDPATDPGVVAAAAERAAKRIVYEQEQEKYEQLAARAQCEFDGTCGTGSRGDGPQYRAAKALADAQLLVVQAAEGDRRAAEAGYQEAWNAAVADGEAAAGRAVEQAEENLAADSAALVRLVELRSARQAAFDAQNGGSDGILARLEALERLGNERPVLGTAQLMLSLLVMSIEILPVLLKVLLNFAPPSAYDRLAALRETADVEAEERRRAAERTVAEAEAELVVAVGRDRVERRRRAELAVNEEVVGAQTRVIRQALRVWGSHAQQASARQLQDYEDQLRRSRAGGPVPDLVEGDPTWTAHPSLPPRNGPAGPAPAMAGSNGFISAAQLPDPGDL